MDFAPTAEQAELKKSARRFLEERCARRVRVVAEGDRGWDEAAWASACELGWPSLCEVGWVELALVAEEAGRTLACLPFFSSIGLGASALRAGNAAPDVLRRVETGDALAALVPDPRVAARSDGAGVRLSGEASLVVDGHTADVLVVVAGQPEPALFVVDAGTPGVERTRVPSLDPTRALARVVLRDVALPASAKIGDASSARVALDRAAVALAAECVGGAERCLEMATDYAKTRVQFDRPIGSFQAIKHRLADMFVAVETSRSAAYWAASVAATGDAAELRSAAAVAKSYCTEVFFRCAAECLQVHGGIGFTWEHDAHLFLRRARSSLALLGPPSQDRETVMAEVEAWI